MQVKLKVSVTMALCLALVAVVNFASAQEVAKPVEQHEVLKLDLGTWTAKMKMWMPGQDEPIEAEGTETNRMLGGFWVVSEFKADMFGQPFEGSGQFGYDDKKDKYVGTWIDNMEPYMSTMEGSWDAEKRTMTFDSKGTDPQTGKTRKGKNVVVYKENGDRLMTMYMDMEGKMTKSMEIAYTKKE